MYDAVWVCGYVGTTDVRCVDGCVHDECIDVRVCGWLSVGGCIDVRV